MRNRTVENLTAAAGALLGLGLLLACMLAIISDCGPSGDGQRECLAGWAGAAAHLVGR